MADALRASVKSAKSCVIIFLSTASAVRHSAKIGLKSPQSSRGNAEYRVHPKNNRRLQPRRVCGLEFTPSPRPRPLPRCPRNTARRSLVAFRKYREWIASNQRPALSACETFKKFGRSARKENTARTYWHFFNAPVLPGAGVRTRLWRSARSSRAGRACSPQVPPTEQGRHHAPCHGPSVSRV